jgi:hypothetical protein
MTSTTCCSRHATPCPGPAWKPRSRPSWPKAGPGGTAGGWFSCRLQAPPPPGAWPWAWPRPQAPQAPVPGTIRTAAFTLARNANGTASLTLNQDQTFDPATLQHALARDGIPALVQTGTYCTSTPAPPSSGVVSIELPDGSPVPYTGRQSPVPPDAVTVINPAAMPTGTELSFTYLNHDHVLTGSLIYTAAHTCSSTPPAGLRPAG